MKTQPTPFYFYLLAFLFFANVLSAQVPNLVISEIMYNPPEDGADSLEYIEIYNNELTSINLDGINFTKGITHTFSNQIIPAQEFILVAKDSIAFQNVFGLSATQWESGTLSNNGEILEISTANGMLIDRVEYQATPPWATAANGLGASLVLCDYTSDNNTPTNWMAATTATNNFVNGKEIIANPFADSDCPTGPIIGFAENSFSLLEENTTIHLQIVLESGNVNPTEIQLMLSANSVGVLNQDFELDNTLPLTITFAAGVEKDTQIISVHILEDANIEANELVNFILENPNNDAIVNPMHDNFSLIIEDDDAALPNLVINEIMYNPPETGSDSTEFIELFNADTFSVNLMNYTFSAGVNFTFPEIILAPDEYIVITRDSNAFANYYGYSALQWTSGSLTNSGEILELKNPGGSVADFVEYSNTAQWSTAANGNGASLVLCDANADNNNPDNWNASISPTGIFIEGKEIMADPMMENNCFVPLSAFPIRSIGAMTSVNFDGVLDSLNRKCELQGIVHGVNLNAANDGLQFVMIDGNGDGITVYNNAENFGYSVAEGDELIVQGTITQFNGLAEIIPDTLWAISNNNTLTNPIEVNLLDESTENQLVKIKNLSIVNPSEWDNSTAAGFTVEVTNGTQTFQMRIDQDVDLFNLPVPDFTFDLTGLGSQFDMSAPFLEGYQIYPRYIEDLEMITVLKKVELDLEVKIYPNPVGNFLFLEMKRPAENAIVENLMGQPILKIANPDSSERIDCQNWQSGIYVITLIFQKEKKVFKIFKE